MNTQEKEIETGIYEFLNPWEVDAGEWLENHLDCDAIIDDLGTKIVVYAYTRNPQFNRKLSDYRKESYSGKTILRGISSVGLNSIF